jgi:hypothetical protein
VESLGRWWTPNGEWVESLGRWWTPNGEWVESKKKWRACGGGGHPIESEWRACISTVNSLFNIHPVCEPRCILNGSVRCIKRWFTDLYLSRNQNGLTQVYVNRNVCWIKCMLNGELTVLAIYLPQRLSMLRSTSVVQQIRTII